MSERFRALANVIEGHPFIICLYRQTLQTLLPCVLLNLSFILVCLPIILLYSPYLLLTGLYLLLCLPTFLVPMPFVLLLV